MRSRSGVHRTDITTRDQYRCVSGVIRCIWIIKHDFERDTRPLAGPHNLTVSYTTYHRVYAIVDGIKEYLLRTAAADTSSNELSLASTRSKNEIKRNKTPYNSDIALILALFLAVFNCDLTRKITAINSP